jgi:nucleoside-diphosphate-sugar epimerase
VRVVVTGASGNLGTALLRRLTGAPADVDVVAIARHPPEPGTPAYDRVRWELLDVAAPDVLPALTAAMRGADAVVNLVWAIQPSHDELTMTRTNVGGAAAVIQATRAAGVGHLVQLSSAAVYAPHHHRAIDRQVVGPPPVTESAPRHGLPGSTYALHKVLVEALLDLAEAASPELTVTRVRPTLVVQGAAAQEISRYFLGRVGGGVAGRVVPGGRLPGRLPVLPFPSDTAFEVVHADDVADLVARVLQRRAGGAFNVAAAPALTATDLSELLGARLVHVPPALVAGALRASWTARLQPMHPSWLTLLREVPLLDVSRAERELGWQARRDPRDALGELLAGMRTGRGAPAPPIVRAG